MSRNRTSLTSQVQHRRFVTATATLFVLGAAMTAKTTDAFVCNAAGTRSHHHVASSTTSSLHYSPMPDIADMKAGDMKHELESYGIPTNTMFDKRDFEAALLDARRDYEQTLKDCMGNTPFSGSPKKKKYNAEGYEESENDFTSVDTSTDSFTNKSGSSQQKKKTIPYDRTNPSHFHERERMWDIGSDYKHADPDTSPFDPTQARSHYHPRDPYYRQSQGNRGAHVGVGVETDPLFAHEEQYAYAGGPRPGRGPPPPPPPHAHDYGRERRHHGAPPPPPPNADRRPREPQYNDPAVQMKYHQALQESYCMKVEDLQKELNGRGISTKYCFTLRDFCIEYAKALAEGKTSSNIKDDDYDPSYRDVVMEPYDPTSFF